MRLTDADPNNSHDGQMKVHCMIQTIREDQHRLLGTPWRLSFIQTREISPPTSTARVIPISIFGSWPRSWDMRSIGRRHSSPANDLECGRSSMAIVMNRLQSRAWLVTCVRNQLITDARRIYSHQTRRISHASAVCTSHQQTLSYRKQLRVDWCKEPTVITRPWLTPWRPLCQTGLSRSFGTVTLRAERQSARMSKLQMTKITNDRA